MWPHLMFLTGSTLKNQKLWKLLISADFPTDAYIYQKHGFGCLTCYQCLPIRQQDFSNVFNRAEHLADRDFAGRQYWCLCHSVGLFFQQQVQHDGCFIWTWRSSQLGTMALLESLSPHTRHTGWSRLGLIPGESKSKRKLAFAVLPWAYFAFYSPPPILGPSFSWQFPFFKKNKNIR